jgi:hypothetical protein
VTLRIVSFEGDDDDPDPTVLLLMQEWKVKSATRSELIREQYRHARLSELQDPPKGKATRGGAFARQVRNLAPIACGCGCGQETSGTEFRQGHDAKLKSKLLKIMRGKLEDPNISPEEAETQLRERNWL